MKKDKRLIERGFPCHQVGAETARERGASSALPPLYFLHVWWARRPLIPSRAAILASLLDENFDQDSFLIDLGIRKAVRNKNGKTVGYKTGDPASAKKRIMEARKSGSRFPGDAYGYPRAFTANPLVSSPSRKILDPMAGGGSIPFEAIRLGHRVFANELNSVGVIILYATLVYPLLFGKDLLEDIRKWSGKLFDRVKRELASFYPSEPGEDVVDYIFCRTVTCPSCGKIAPLLNTCFLSKQKGASWGVRVIPEKGGEVSFRVYKVKNDKGPNGEDPRFRTITRGLGKCIHCDQAISAHEIKAQASGESVHGKWRDRLYAVVATRHVSTGGFYSSGPKKGEEKLRRVKFFRVPCQADLEALNAAERTLEEKWEDWEKLGLIPTERFPGGNDLRPIKYGMSRWCDFFTPRQLLCHLTIVDKLNQLKRAILDDLGSKRGRAVITYLQLAVDKGIDYNSRQTRWEYTRGIVKGTFSRHDFSVKWTFGEMSPCSEKGDMLTWILKQIADSYGGICKLLENVERKASEPRQLYPVISNYSASHLPHIEDRSIDLVCMDPPYYDNVQYAELSDYFYVWHKRVLADLYPDLFKRRQTDKKSEAVANPARFKAKIENGQKISPKEQARKDYEKKMAAIFKECHRVLKDDGILTVMFTHKSEEAWEALAKSLMESGWVVTSSIPVDTESGYSIHIRGKAAALSTVFLSARKRLKRDSSRPAPWTGLGEDGVKFRLREEVRNGLKEFKKLDLSDVDLLLGSYGRALHALSREWPVLDGDELVTPARAMLEASIEVAEFRLEEITGGRLTRASLDSETAAAVLTLANWGLNEVSFDSMRKMALALGIQWVNKTGAYTLLDSRVGFFPIKKKDYGTFDFEGRAARDRGIYAPFIKYGSFLRLARPEQRHVKRIEKPASDWDGLCGIIMSFRQNEFPGVMNYLNRTKLPSLTRTLDLLEIWTKLAKEPQLEDEAKSLVYFLKNL